ncbi:hypothetical protein [Nocardia donostiensis]|uniref:Uncharacterized protein n=1 Tax=Nocardia donostiensis TaxID=1538463 RepID=A0A1V2TAD4_9NOCA|nr:hypothetical protein [Nocardia donostiensis]ONM46464.1 hypothetical protein B0T46_22805 [Nocardia donostiensis]OQS18134.1 hypothetical protein B0T44_21325 [Nocardia donostiensis]
MKDEGASNLDHIYPALGRLVVNSGFMETHLRLLVSWLADIDDASIIFDGQSVDWLTQSGQAILRELKQTKDFRLQDCERFENALARAKKLNGQRNLYVHGHWSVHNMLDDYTPRPRTSPEDHRIFYVCRSRLRRAIEEYEVAVVDVETLADQMLELVHEIDEAVHEGNILRWVVLQLDPPPTFPDELNSAALNALRRVMHKRAVRKGQDVPPPS